jgi:Flp pilus assembly protein TadB
MRYEIIVGRSSTADPEGSLKPPGRFQRLKTFLVAFVTVCVLLGVLMAAFVVGLAIAGIILVVLFVAICVLMATRLWRRHTQR